MIRIYARIAAAALLAVAVTGWAVLGWATGAVLYHAAVALLFAFAGFLSTTDGWTVRMMVGGLGVLLIAVKAVMILGSWFSPAHVLLGPVEITCLVVGVSSVLAARYLRDGR